MEDLNFKIDSDKYLGEKSLKKINKIMNNSTLKELFNMSSAHILLY